MCVQTLFWCGIRWCASDAGGPFIGNQSSACVVLFRGIAELYVCHHQRSDGATHRVVQLPIASWEPPLKHPPFVQLRHACGACPCTFRESPCITVALPCWAHQRSLQMRCSSLGVERGTGTRMLQFVTHVCVEHWGLMWHGCPVGVYWWGQGRLPAPHRWPGAVGFVWQL